MKKWAQAQLKTIYLCFIKMISFFSFGKNNQIVYLLSFPETSTYLLDLLSEKYQDSLTIIYTKNAESLALSYKKNQVRTYPLSSLRALFVKVVPTITGSRIILCDNYFAILAGIHFRKDAKVVQLWHANGAIKCFGFEANYTKNVTKKDQQRYQAVYRKFTHYIVSSSKMAEIFERSYRQKVNYLPFGYPPTDQYFNQEKSKNKFSKAFSTSKKSLLYVPTYREEENLVIDYQSIASQLGKDWQLFLKVHPHDVDKEQAKAQRKDWITDFKGLSLSEMLPNIDCLVTDYSSVPFEYSLANPNGKMLFYCEDLEQYQQTVGLQFDFLNWLPGKLVKNQEELIQAIHKDEDVGDVASFNQLWNTYAKGDAANQFLEWMEKNDK